MPLAAASRSLAALLLLVASASVASLVPLAAHPESPAAAPAALADAPAAPAPAADLAMPFFFEANVGQAPPDAQFVAVWGGTHVFLLRDGLRVASEGTEATLRFADSDPHAWLEGADARSSYTSYFTTSTTAQQAAHFGKVAYHGLYPGIDVVFYAAADGALEFDYDVAPGADPAAIRLVSDQPLAVGPEGSLDFGDFSLHAPVAYQESAGGRSTVAGSYATNADGSLGFAVGAYDAGRPLVIDPKLGFSTYFGGDATETFTAVKGYGGFVYAAGQSTSADANRCTPLAVCPAAYTTTGAPTIVAKFDLTVNGTASLVWVARIGGLLQIWGIDVDATGIYLTGAAGVNMPLSGNAFQIKHGTTYGSGLWSGTNCASPNDAFLMRLDLPAQNILYASYIGGQFDEQGYAVTSEGTGRAVIAGYAQWTNGVPFPTVNGFQMVNNGPPASNATCAQGTERGCLDAIVARFDTTVPSQPGGINTNSLLFSTFAGAGGVAPPDCTSPQYTSYPVGTGNDVATDVKVDANGGIWVAGYTTATAATTPTFPAASGGASIPAFQAAPQGAGDAFLLKIAGNGTLQYSSFLGGTGLDRAYGLALTPTRAYLTGVTKSTDFPMNGAAYRTTAYGGTNALQDAFVASVSLTTGQLVKSTYFGSPGEPITAMQVACGWDCGTPSAGNDAGNSIQVQPGSGNIMVEGVTDKGSDGVLAQFPRLHAWPGLAGKRLDLFMANFTPDLGTLLFSTAVGSMMDDVPTGTSTTGSFTPGFPIAAGYPSPGHLGTLVVDADSVSGGSNPVVAGGMAWPTWPYLTTTWDFGDGASATMNMQFPQQYYVHQYQFTFPPSGVKQFNVTITVTDALGDVSSYTKPMIYVRCPGAPTSQFMTPNPPTVSWPTPQIRMGWFQYDNTCINSSSYNVYQGLFTGSYPTAGGFPIDHSASILPMPIPALKSFHRSNFALGTMAPCCSSPTLLPPDAVLARMKGPAEPWVVCGTTTVPPLYRNSGIGFTWGPAGVLHTQGIETYDPNTG
ncbi:MAG: PKD domain-containing protein, partial [Halobacteriales archaeon]|nr:PKD domain-containing protein [Halobacteriales archaeon]